jgi:hypothetical protein
MKSDDDSLLSRLPVHRVGDESVLLDSDLAALYGVETKVFNQAIRRNRHRFPRDFAFQLTSEEWSALRSQIVTLKPGERGQHRKYLPRVFTEHGAIVAVTILNSGDSDSITQQLIVPVMLPNPKPAYRVPPRIASARWARPTRADHLSVSITCTSDEFPPPPHSTNSQN